jgi:hypothetical protein
MQRTVHLTIALVFAVFAALNLNDPDPWTWVLAYTSVAVLYSAAAFGRADRRLSGGLCLFMMLWMLTMLPGMVQWAGAGFPSITASMKATEPHIEVVREFLGLLLAVLALGWLTWSTPGRAAQG